MLSRAPLVSLTGSLCPDSSSQLELLTISIPQCLRAVSGPLQRIPSLSSVRLVTSPLIKSDLHLSTRGGEEQRCAVSCDPLLMDVG